MIEETTTSYPVSLQEFKSWKARHEGCGHKLLRADDFRVKARGIVCLDCQGWWKVLASEWDADPELKAWALDQTEQAKGREEDFRWVAAKGPVFEDDFSMTSNYYSDD